MHRVLANAATFLLGVLRNSGSCRIRTRLARRLPKLCENYTRPRIRRDGALDLPAEAYDARTVRQRIDYCQQPPLRNPKNPESPPVRLRWADSFREDAKLNRCGLGTPSACWSTRAEPAPGASANCPGLPIDAQPDIAIVRVGATMSTNANRLSFRFMRNSSPGEGKGLVGICSFGTCNRGRALTPAQIDEFAGKGGLFSLADHCQFRMMHEPCIDITNVSNFASGFLIQRS